MIINFIQSSKGEPQVYKSDVLYYTGLVNIERKHPVCLQYVDFKINQYEKLLQIMNPKQHQNRINELIKLKNDFKEVKRCLLS
jgi:hypothetical protein